MKLLGGGIPVKQEGETSEEFVAKHTEIRATWLAPSVITRQSGSAELRQQPKEMPAGIICV